MWLKKHFLAKVVAASAALASMLGVWVAVRANPPAPTDAATAPPVAAAPAAAASSRPASRVPASAPRAPQQVAPKPQTRTHAS